MSSAEEVARNNRTTLPPNPRFQAAPGWSPWQDAWPWRLVDTVHFAFTDEFEANLESMINSGTFRAVLATPPVEFKRWKVTSQARPAPYDALDLGSMTAVTSEASSM
jgi:hypothetical protein